MIDRIVPQPRSVAQIVPAREANRESIHARAIVDSAGPERTAH
jgi:hypothetical protein